MLYRPDPSSHYDLHHLLINVGIEDWSFLYFFFISQVIIHVICSFPVFVKLYTRDLIIIIKYLIGLKTYLLCLFH